MARPASRSRRSRAKRLLALSVLGAAVAFGAVELGLRAAGLAFKAELAARQRRAASSGLYRILCLGESTTLGANVKYPDELEKILNAQAPRVAVINGGVAGIDSDEILRRLDDNLERWRPRMVVAMMGANDQGTPWAESLERKRLPWGLERLQSARLAALYWSGFFEGPATTARTRRIERRYDLARALRARAWRAFDTGRPWLASAFFHAARAVMGADDEAELGLAACALARGDAEKARLLAAKRPEALQWDAMLYVVLGERYESEQSWPDAARVFEKSEESMQSRRRACARLERLFSEKGDAESADAAADAGFMTLLMSYHPAFELGRACVPPRAQDRCGQDYLDALARADEAELQAAKRFGARREERWMTSELSRFERGGARDAYAKYLMDEGDLASAERELKRSIALEPMNAETYSDLSVVYERKKRWGDLERLLARAAASDPESDLKEDRLAAFYRSRGRPADALHHARAAQRLRDGRGLSMTQANYVRLADALRARGVALVCVPYPMHKADELRRLLAGRPGVFFVDNDRGFVEQAAEGGLMSLFTDLFGGSFGHCTPLGYRILARNVAAVVEGALPAAEVASARPAAPLK